MKKLSKNKKDTNKKEELQKLHLFFREIWIERKHNCESCTKYLGEEPASYMFDHLLEKSKYPDLKYDKNNIFICCLDCHTLKTNGHPTTKHLEAINNIKQKYGR